MIKNIVILGGGLEACVTAALLANALEKTPIKICVVSSPGDGRVGDCRQPSFAAESLLPQTQIFHEHLALDEATLLRDAKGVFNFGVHFHSWRAPDEHFFQTYDNYGTPFSGIEFHHYYRLLQTSLGLPPYDQFSLPAMAGANGRFCHPSADPRSVVSMLTYGLNLDRAGYARALKASAQSRGVTFINGEFETARLAEDGSVKELVLTDRVLPGCLFVDCSGKNSRLLGGTLGVPLTDWSSYFPCNTSLTFPAPHDNDIPSANRLSADKLYWEKVVPLRNHQVVTRVFDSDAVTADEVAGGGAPEAAIAALAVGHKTQPWHGNVIAFGEAAACFEPLPCAGIDLLYRDISTFLDLLPVHADFTANARQYNAIVVAHYEHLRDYHLAHYLLPPAAPCYIARRHRPPLVPQKLAHHIALFEHCGKNILEDHDVVPAPMWTSLFLGLGVGPERYDPRADNQDRGELTKSFKRMHGIIAQTARQLPHHAEYLERYTGPCGSSVKEEPADPTNKWQV